MRVLVSSLLLVSLAMTFCSLGEAADKSLVLYYSFDEEDPKVVKDLSQYGNDGVIEGEADYVEGKIGSAMKFDGSLQVMAEHNDVLSLTDAHTIAYWLKWDGSGANWSPFISKILVKDGVVQDNYHTWVGNDKVWDYSVWPNPQAHGKTPIPLDNEWIHLTVTHDGSDNISFSIDGELDNEGKIPTGKACKDCLFLVGGDSENFGAGTLDELAVFSRELDADDINKLMNEGPEPFTAVEYAGKLTNTWGGIKGKY